MLSILSLTFVFINIPIGNKIYNIWFILEVLIICGVIIFQFWRAKSIKRRIDQLKDIFKYPLKVIQGTIEREHLVNAEDAINKIEYTNKIEDSNSNKNTRKNVIKVSIVETSGYSKPISRMKDAINTYLLSNYGAAVNFSIIKDIIDREIDVQDEEISQDIPTPLYAGLAATMIGIILGLLSMPALGGNNFTLGINSLIDGVKLAMFASLLGLSFTTYLSSFHYKNAKKKILLDKNFQISYLQAKLLPELIKAEDTGVSGLKASLDRFAKVATDISDNVLIATKQTSENLILQQEVIEKVSNLDIIKISETNLDLFKRLEDNIGALQKFSEYMSALSQISNNLKEFAFRTLDINRVVNKIDTGLEENSRLTRFLASHFEKIETAGNAALKAVDLSDLVFKESIERLREETDKCVTQALQAVNLSSSHFTTAIEKLKEETDNRISLLNQDAASSESKLCEIYNDIGSKLNMITEQHIKQIQSAYSNAIPQFNQLNNLQVLPKIQEEVTSGVSQIQHESSSNTSKLIENINHLNHSLNDVIKTIENNAILSKLDSIEVNYQKHISDVLHQFQTESNSNTTKLVGAINKLNHSFDTIINNQLLNKLDDIENYLRNTDNKTENQPVSRRKKITKPKEKPGLLKRIQNRLRTGKKNK